jgi:steroid 5-alpha reductase family enzyme
MSAPTTTSIASLFDPGILRSALLPSLQVHTALAIPTYLIARSANVVEVKDFLWGAGQVINIWYASVGRAVINDGVPVRVALRALSRPSKLLLAGVTLWGGRLFYRVLSRAIKRNFADDPRYADAKTSSDWNWAPLTQYLPEAIFQAVIALGYTFPFYAVNAKALIIPTDWTVGIEAAAVGIWTAGFALESIADWQIAHYKAQGGRGLCRDGVWSIVRHPK